MSAEFYRSGSLVHLFDWTQQLHRRTNWLFVRLDSSQDFLKMGEQLSPIMSRQNLSFWWGEEGLWIPGDELGGAFVREKIVVPFSACYIFDRHIKKCAKPNFNMTTDSGHLFMGSEISSVSEEISKLGALGYAADGCGLQWVTSNQELYRLIHQGKNLHLNES
jgi:hypothetical protein